MRNRPFRILSVYQNGCKIGKDLNEDILKQDRKEYFSNLGIHSRIRLFIEEYCYLYKEYSEKYGICRYSKKDC